MFKVFEDREILLAYYGGSRAYQNSNEKSDKDIIVILNDFDGAMHIADRETNCEYYVFGRKYYNKKMEFHKSVTPLLKIFNDDILSPLEPLILDESYKETYLSYKNRDFKKYLKPYLNAVVEYYETFLYDGSLKKNLYHLYRIEEQVKRYLETNEFKVELSEEVIEKIIVFKENFKSNSPEYFEELRNILNYLKAVRDNVRD